MSYDWNNLLGHDIPTKRDIIKLKAAINRPAHIDNAFIFAETEEGHDFWWEIFIEQKHTNKSCAALKRMIRAAKEARR